MLPKLELDLTGDVSWIGLLKFKNAMIKLVSGETLEILTKDPETVEGLSRLVQRSDDQMVLKTVEQDHFRIRIQRG